MTKGKDKNKVRVFNVVAILIAVLCFPWLPLTAVAAESSQHLCYSLPHTGTEKLVSGNVEIDVTHTFQGYFSHRYTGSSEKVAVQVQKQGTNRLYTYHLPVTGQYNTVAFTQGSGRYSITVWEHCGGSRYAFVAEFTVDVEIEHEYLPFLYPSHMVPFNTDSLAVLKSRELVENFACTPERINAVYTYVVENIRYDQEKAKSIPPGYRSVSDDTFKNGTGICVDYTTLLAAMLRSQGIPTKLIYGYAPNGQYHSWVSVYAEESGQLAGSLAQAGTWVPLDPTFSAAANREISKPFSEEGYVTRYIY